MLKLVALEQGSEEWKGYRSDKIGASEAPIIMGTSPYKTANILMREKLGIVEQPEMNGAMAWGHSKEQEIRSWLSIETKDLFHPEVVVHPEHEWMMASLDGLNMEKDTICELKTCNEKIFAEALDGRVVPHYYDQIQHQLACCPGIEICYYVCLHKGNFASIKVTRDEARIQEIIKAEQEFYQKFLDGRVPDHKEKAPPTGYTIVEDEEAIMLSTLLVNELALQKDLATSIKETKERLLSKINDSSSFVGNLRITRSDSAGSVDWKRVADDYSVSDLDKYRGPPSVRWTITERKKNDN